MITPGGLSRCHTLLVPHWCTGRCVERVAFDLQDMGARRSKVSSLKNLCSLGTDQWLRPLGSLSGLHLCFSFLNAPFWSKSSLIGWKVGEAFDIVTVPEEELEIFCRVLDVDEIVHKVAGGARLQEILP